MSSGSDDFRTEDLALATVLSMQGCDTGELAYKKPGSREAEWQIERDDRLDMIVSGYNSGTHQVEPRHFMASLQKVRKQLYAFLDSP